LNQPGGTHDEDGGPSELSVEPLTAGVAAVVLPAPEAVVLAGGPARSSQRWKTIVRDLAILAIVLAVIAAIYSERSTTAKGIRHLRDLDWAWIPAVSLAQVLSMVAFGRLYQVLLQANRNRLKLPWILAASFAANAVSSFVPVVGSGMASRQNFLWLREGGAESGAATLTLTVAGVVSTVTLATVATTAAVLSGSPAAAISGLLTAVVMVAVVVGVAVELRTETGRTRLRRLTAFLIRVAQRVIRRPKGEPEVMAQSVLASLLRFELGGSTLVRVLLLGLVNWWADVACLAFSMRAAGIDDLSLGQLLLVWTAAVGAASLSPTPAGIGAVEIAMVAALAGVGVRGPEAITAVLVYRAVTLKLGGTVVAYIYATLHRRRQRRAEIGPIAE
jgi:putative heme transporter